MKARGLLCRQELLAGGGAPALALEQAAVSQVAVACTVNIHCNSLRCCESRGGSLSLNLSKNHHTLCIVGVFRSSTGH